MHQLVEDGLTEIVQLHFKLYSGITEHLKHFHTGHKVWLKKYTQKCI